MKTIHKSFSVKPINTEAVEGSRERGVTFTRLGETIGWLMQSCDVFRPGPFTYTDAKIIMTLSDPIFDEERRELCKYIAEKEDLYDSEYFHHRFFSTRTITVKEESE